MKVNVLVKPNSSKQEILYDKDTESYIIWLKSPANEGKANAELLKLMKKHFKKTPRIIAGKTSRKKIIEL